MGTLFSHAEMVKFGNALCASYSYTRGLDGRLVKRDAPLTTVAKLRAYIAKAGRMKGTVAAAKALDFVLEGAASPMENIMSMLICLPKKYGGYGLPNASLNYRVVLSEAAAKTAGQGECYCDLCWPSSRLDVEYDSDQEHTGSERIAKDARRRNALQQMRYQVNVIGRKQLEDPDLFENEIQAICKALGVYLRKTTPAQKQKKVELRKTVMTWMPGAYRNLAADLRVGDCGW